MPTIKLKKATADYIAEKEREKEREKEKDETPQKKKTKVKHSISPGSSVLKRLAGAEVLDEKRKRSIPVSEQTLLDWVDANLTSKTGVYLNKVKLYETYCGTCHDTMSTVLELPHFSRIIKDKVGAEFSFKEASPLNGIIKESMAGPKIPRSKSKKKDAKDKINMLEVIEEVLIATGNPNSGLRFGRIVQGIAVKHPALRVDKRIHHLLNCLDNAVYNKQLTLVKGIGKCGHYRITGRDADKAEETEEKTDDDKDKTGDDETKEAKKSKKRKSAGKDEESKENGEVKEEGEEVEVEGTDEEPKKKKPRQSHSGTSEPWVKSHIIHHSNPASIEESFPLAMTYSCEPKQSTNAKIKKYIQKNYPSVDIETKYKSALDKGTEIGIWEYIGSGLYALNIQEFDPNRKDSMDDIICAAIIATTEPKICSAQLIKRYIMDYHPDFGIEEKPQRFKHALEKGVRKGILRQITGIGSNGSYQLVVPFQPSPGVLAGDEDDELIETIFAKDDKYTEMYVPRPTKSRRNAVTSKLSTGAPAPPRAPPKDRTIIVSKKLPKPAGIVKKVPKVKKNKRGRKSVLKSKQEADDEPDDEPEPKVEPEDEDEPEDELEAPVSRKPANKKGKQKKTPAKSPTKEEIEDEEQEETSSSPAKRARVKNTPKKRVLPKTTGRSPRTKAVKSYSENKDSDIDASDDDADEDINKGSDEEEEAKGKSSQKSGKKSEGEKRGRSPRKKSVTSYNEDEDDDDEPTSKKSRSRK